MKIISLEELKRVSENLSDDILLLDVRTSKEHSEGKIPGSKNISHETVDDFVDELKSYEEIYIFCQKGGRAKKAADALEDEGLSNIKVVVDGGFEAWCNEGYPTE